ncbi:carboxylesterase family protein [Streptomyces sp. NPDC002758]
MRRLAALVSVLATLAWGLSGAPAAATVIDQNHYANTDSYTYSDCGYEVAVQTEVSGTYHLREGKGDEESAYFLTDAYSFREVHTNVETGKWFVLYGQGVTKEIGAKQVESSVYEFTTVVAGQPFVVEDSAGHTVLRQRGEVRYRTLFDTGGDDDPGGTLVDFLDAEFRGPHPGGFPDFCAIAGGLIGTGSAKGLTARPAGTTAAPLGYYEYLPPGYSGGAKRPLLLALNGFGENGDGSAEQLPTLLNTGIPRLISTNGWQTDRPFVVLAPQHNYPQDDPRYAPCDDGRPFLGSCVMRIQHDLGNPPGVSPCTTPAEVHAFLAYAKAAYHVDQDRIYVTGLSCGAYGAWEHAAQYPGDGVAAMVPISGDGRPAWDAVHCDLGREAVWAFAGDADDLVNPVGSIEPITNLQSCPSPPRREAKLTVYPGVDHDAWSGTYSGSAGNDIYTWLLGFTAP